MVTINKAAGAEGFQPRVFWGDEQTETTLSNGSTLSPRMTLSAFYFNFHKPIILAARQTKDRTFREYERSLRYWMQATGDPPLCEIDDAVCTAFVVGLAKLPGQDGGPISPNTIRKHASAVQMMLDMVGPKSTKRRKAAELLEVVPFIERPSEVVNEDLEVFTLGEIGAMLHATKQAKPRKDMVPPPADFWHGLFGFAFYTGLRIDTLMRLEWEMIQAEHLVLPDKVMKKGKGRTLPLSQPARQMLEPLRPYRRKTPRVFPWPNWPGDQSNMQQRHRRHLQEVAGLPEERRFGFHAFRRAHATYLSKIDANAAVLSCGHSAAKTTQKHYLDRQIVADALDQLPEIEAKPLQENERQLRLF